jgi:hypothetical protein
MSAQHYADLYNRDTAIIGQLQTSIREVTERRSRFRAAVTANLAPGEAIDEYGDGSLRVIRLLDVPDVEQLLAAGKRFFRERGSARRVKVIRLHEGDVYLATSDLDPDEAAGSEGCFYIPAADLVAE